MNLHQSCSRPRLSNASFLKANRWRLCFVLIQASWWLVASASGQVATDHHFEIVSPDVAKLPFVEILDGLIATPQIGENPRHGYLEIGEDFFIYHPQTASGAPFYGLDTFTFRLGSGEEETSEARVTINILPERQPLAGRWETRTCNESTCTAKGCSFGDGAELGWYDTRDGTFFLCDWEGGSSIEVCGRYRVPRSIFRGGVALVLDWDSDGWDEPALQDPLSGDILVFESSGANCPGECEGHCLDVVAVFGATPAESGHGARLFPVAGSWRGLSPIDALGAYDPISRQIGLGLIQGIFRENFSFAAEEPVRALAGDWLGGAEPGSDTLGLWSHRAGVFQYLADSSPGGSWSFAPELPIWLLDRSLPFGAKQNGCVGSDLAFFDPEGAEVYFVPLNNESGEDRDGVRVRVPTDPAGWPSSEPCGDKGDETIGPNHLSP